MTISRSSKSKEGFRPLSKPPLFLTFFGAKKESKKHPEMKNPALLVVRLLGGIK